MEYPLISCIMPTAGRRRFLARSIELFCAQEYPNKELVIIEDGPELNADIALGLNYHYLPGPLTIGEKRNLAMRNCIARGEILCHWDDDDYYGPQRLSMQAMPLLSGLAEVSAFRMSLLFRTRDATLWTCSEQVHAALFAHNVRSSTLMYRASYWHDGLRYPDASVGEDVAFLNALLASGARLASVEDPESYICVRHGNNTTEEPFGLESPGWSQVEPLQYLSFVGYYALRGLLDAEAAPFGRK